DGLALARRSVGKRDRCVVGIVLGGQPIEKVVVEGDRLPVEVGRALDVPDAVVLGRRSLAQGQDRGDSPAHAVVLVLGDMVIGVGQGDQVAQLVVPVLRPLVEGIYHRLEVVGVVVIVGCGPAQLVGAGPDAASGVIGRGGGCPVGEVGLGQATGRVVDEF